MSLDLAKTRSRLADFDFHRLFIEELGWSQPATRRPTIGEVLGTTYNARMIAELAGVAVFEVWCDGAVPERKLRDAIERDIAKQHRENLCIFLDREANATQSFWVWANRERDEHGKPKRILREHTYFRGQPADLFLTKLQSLVVELSEFSDSVGPTVVEVARRMKEALDVERVIKKFYTAYERQHAEFLALIEGIDNERDRRWYASIILNRVMFVWFMQKKFFLGDRDADYLARKLEESRALGKDRFFGEFLKALFFEAFAKPEGERSSEARALTGAIPYLNGGLFLPHRIECEADGGTLRVGRTLRIPDQAFANLFKLFSTFTWHLDDTPGGKADEINPDVLGYIFEKYINQKAFGAYYTRPEITEYLAEHTIHGLVLDRIRRPALPELGLAAVDFASVAELLARMDAPLAIELVDKVLPSLKLLDPAVGSGAFLLAAMKTLINLYTAVVGRAEMGESRELKHWLDHIRARHRNVAYYIKRRVITDNLFGVDIMEEATEIAKLRLFLALVASARSVDELEPLPNIDFNIMAGNSLVGLMHVDPRDMDAKGDLVSKSYGQLLKEKDRLISLYRNFGNDPAFRGSNLRGIKRDIESLHAEARPRLNELLGQEFGRLGVKFEEETWDDAKGKEGKPRKRPVNIDDIKREHPFHWGYEFDEIVQRADGFDGIITNPPWEIVKPQDKEFFQEDSDLVSKNKMTIKEFEKERTTLLKKKDLRAAYLDYLSRFPHMSAYYRASPLYPHQSAIVGGKKTGSDLNLYKLFTEQCFNLLKPGGRCGIVIPSGIYTDLGAKGLRDLLFGKTRIEGLFCFENRKTIFEGVDSRFKFVVLTFEKSVLPRRAASGTKNTSAPPDDLLAPTLMDGVGTRAFPAAFMRHDVAELARFPDQGAIEIDVALVRRLSPDSHSVMEFKSALDVTIAKKMLKFPLLGERIEGAWNLSLTREFDMTNDSHLFKTEPGEGRLPLYEGKMIWQFEHRYAESRYWVDEREGRKVILGRTPDSGQPLDYQAYRIGFRDIAANTNERTMVASLIPPAFHGNKLPTARIFDAPGKRLIDDATQLFLCAIWNSFVIDWMLRQKVSTTLNFFYIYQLPVPRLIAGNPAYSPIVSRAARLVCTTPEFGDLAKEADFGDHTAGATDPAERARLRAELDGLVAHLYGVTEEEFAHILSTFPLVPDPVKLAARNAYRDVERGLIR